MNRLEFTRKIKAAAALRSAGRCEKCSANLKAGEAEYDHILPAALGGDNSLQNCQVLCTPCHRGSDGKTSQDIRRIRKADRQRDKANGAIRPSSKLSKPKLPKPALTKTLPPKPMFRSIEP